MRQLLVLPLLLAFFLPYTAFCQEYSYTHYDVKDGLAGSNVYCITQDKQGFLWMGTEGGVSRYDGTHFKNFTLEDGLPDIEVLQVFADSKGRVWMGLFGKSICYYYEGKIHNQENDPMLRGMQVGPGVDGFAEDKEGNVLIQERSALHVVSPGGQVRKITSINGRPIYSFGIAPDPDGHFFVNDRHEIYRFSGEKFSRYFSFGFENNFSNFLSITDKTMAWRESVDVNSFRNLKTGIVSHFRQGLLKLNHVTYSLIGDSLVYQNETQGTVEFNMFTGAIRNFAIGAKISRTFRDDEGNTWFTSLGQGLFRLNSEDIRNITLLSKRGAQCVAHTVKRSGDKLLIGCSHSMLFQFSLPTFKKDFGKEVIPGDEIDDVHYIEREKDGRMVIGTSIFIFRTIHMEVGKPGTYFSVKSGFVKNDSELLVAGSAGIVSLDRKTLRLRDTLFYERATVVYYGSPLVYAGTLNGLYVIKKDKSTEYWGDKDPLLRKQVSSIAQSPDGTLWVATYGAGIIAIKDGHRVAVLSRKQGLTSDLCRTLTISDHMLWVGTDKGLNKVNLTKPGFPVTTYTTYDGLGSNVINTIYVDSSMIYVCTPAGLSFFDVRHVVEPAGCRLALLGLINSGKDRLSDSAHLRLPFTENNIRFEFAGISYKSAGDISYRYRLLGLDSVWKGTKESFLEYPTLPSGDYELQVQAVNKFNRESGLLSIHLSVSTPFWRTAWFDGLVIVFFLALTWLFLTLRIKQIRRRQAEQEELNKRLAETEHMALQAQMNPHFIFNCLNSIQQYIFDQDVFAANKYITGFAKLIRATLHNSSKAFISLADEIDYLSSYLSLEKLRFKEKMNYTMEIEPSLRPELENIYIPPMLIQPYVENSMRHGLRHKQDGEGIIRIKVMQEGDKLSVVIEDNGIGRDQAARYKTREHIEYQSRGMSLTADRIRLINTVNGDSILAEIIDLKGPLGEAMGTRVIVRFPRFDLARQKDNS